MGQIFDEENLLKILVFTLLVLIPLYLIFFQPANPRISAPVVIEKQNIVVKDKELQNPNIGKINVKVFNGYKRAD